jgi:zinc transport system substrate-binding protein
MKNYLLCLIFFTRLIHYKNAIKRILGFVFYSLLLCLQIVNADNSAKKEIIVTIKPLQGLVQAIAKDTVNIQRLLPDYASLHHYHFRPSDIHKVKAADIVFRIDEHMERFLSPLLATLPQYRVISLADIPQLSLLPVINTENTVKKIDHTEKEHDHEHQHQHGNQDLHIWMSPQNGIVMAQKITDVLSILNPQYSHFYQKNLVDLTKKINQFTQGFQRQAKQFQHKPYLVFHDAWNYFSTSFHLHKLASINLHTDIQLGVKTMLKTRKRIKQSRAICLFSEPNFRPKTVTTLIEGFPIKTIELDTLGSHLKSNDDLYLELLRYTAKQIRNCLS